MTKANPDENDVKDKIKKLLDLHGWFHWPAAASTYGVGGVSDRLAVKRGRLLAIEAKRDATKHPTPLQRRFQKQVVDHGGLALVIHKDNIDTLKLFLQTFDAS